MALAEGASAPRALPIRLILLLPQVMDAIETRLPAEPRRELHLLLRLLGSRLGTLLLLGRASFR